jgi:hypothetical protein
MVSFLVKKGVAPSAILAALPENERNRRFVTFSGVLGKPEVASAFTDLQSRGERVDYTRYFHEEDELLHHDGTTSVLSKMWGITTEQCIAALVTAFPTHDIRFEVAN